jgi:hypothetical protein
MCTLYKSVLTSAQVAEAFAAPLSEISRNEELYSLFLESVERQPNYNGICEDGSYQPILGYDADGYPNKFGERIDAPFVWVYTTLVTSNRARGIIKTSRQYGQYFGLTPILSLAEQNQRASELRAKIAEKKDAKKGVAPKNVSPEDAAF